MRSTRRRRSASVLAALGVLVPLAAAPAGAQDLVDLIPGLFDEDIFLAPPTGPFPSHEAHFVDEGDALRAASHSLNRSMAAQLTTFPLVSSSGGFAYTFDPGTGLFARSTDSFGPLFTERAFTVGDGRWTVGLTHQQASYDSLDDIDLETGALEFQLRHVDNEPHPDRTDPFFEGDLINSRVAIELESATTVFFANYGITERLDFGLAIPFVEVDLAASATLTIDRLATGDITGIHRFPDGSDRMFFSDSGSASGIGDLVLRTKYRFVESEGGGLAGALDLRLPTGDENDLLGTGVTQAKLFFIGSTAWGPLSPHLNLGYTLSSGDSDAVGELPDEVNYSLAFDWAAHPRFTVVAEAIGRTLLDATHVERRDEEFVFVDSDGTQGSAFRPVVVFGEDDEQVLLGAFGFRFNPVGNLLVNVEALFDLGEDGLRDEDAMYLVGFDYSF